MTITITAVNDGPNAVSDSYSTNEDAPLTVAAPGVLANDTDVDSPALTVSVVSTTAHGTLLLNADGSFTYTPAANFNGTDSFTYKANDGTIDSAVASVTITVNGVNDVPAAIADAYAATEDQPLIVGAPGVLANDTDVDGGTLTAVLGTGPANGTLTLNANGGFTYTPAANFNGTDSFTYTANDGTTDSSAATVTITVAAVNDVPVAVNDTYATNEDGVLGIAAPGVLTNDNDVEGSPLSAAVVDAPAHGVLTFNADGSFSYAPNANFNGADSFTYKASDTTADSNVATVTIAVNAVNDAPVATNDSYTTSEDTALTVAAPGVLANDTDVDSNTLTIALVSGPANGTLTLNPDGSFIYTPAANFNGSDSFTYTASDGTADSNVATVTIAVAAVNDAPVAVADAATTAEDTAVTIAGARERYRPRWRHADGDRGEHAGARQRDEPCGRDHHLHAGGQLQRHRRVHLHDRRRPRRHGDGDGERHDHGRQRRAGRGCRCGHDGRGHGGHDCGARERYGLGRRFAGGDRDERAASRIRNGQPGRDHHLRAGGELQRHRRVHLYDQRRPRRHGDGDGERHDRGRQRPAGRGRRCGDDGRGHGGHDCGAGERHRSGWRFAVAHRRGLAAPRQRGRQSGRHRHLHACRQLQRR